MAPKVGLERLVLFCAPKNNGSLHAPKLIRFSELFIRSRREHPGAPHKQRWM